MSLDVCRPPGHGSDRFNGRPPSTRGESAAWYGADGWSSLATYDSVESCLAPAFGPPYEKDAPS